jgi:phosphoadenosine phosphosulfate reductase
MDGALVDGRPDHGGAQALVRTMLTVFPGRIAAVSSFGTESAVVLHLLAEVDKAVPVIFIDTGKLFAETLRYRDVLVAQLGLTDVRTVRPDRARLTRSDPDGDLWRDEPDSCCWNRKVEPLELALSGFAAWITGRKRMHGGARSVLDMVEPGPDGRIKVNPLAGWNADDVGRYFVRHGLPVHPLLAQGFRSVGCATCTIPAGTAGAPRDGRWAGSGKTECGIHVARTVNTSRSLSA